VGIDVHMVVVNLFCSAFKEPEPPITVLLPKWFLPEGSKTFDHFGTRIPDCLVNLISLDSADAEPSDSYHSDMMMAFSLEF